MPTIEQIREKIRQNFPKEAKKPKILVWDRETLNAIVSGCGTYRIIKQEDPLNKGIYGYSLQLVATGTTPPKHLCGPFLLPKDAREAAQRHYDGIPLQADLA